MKINVAKERKKLIEHLKNIELYEKCDENQIEVYLSCLKKYWDFEQILQDKGRTIDTHDSNGILKYSQIRPEVTMQRDALKVINDFSKEFGLTPKSRSQIKLEKKEEEDEFEKLMKGV